MSPEAPPPAAPRPWRLEARLRRQVALLWMTLWLLGCGAALWAVREETDEVLDDALVETGQHLAALPPSAFELAARDPATLAPRGFGRHEEHVVYQVLDRAGRTLLRSHLAPADRLAPATATGTRDHGDWRVAVVDGAETRVLVAETTAHRREVLWEACLWLLMPLALALPLAAWGLHGVLRSAFRSLQPALRQLREGSAPLPLQGVPAELLPLLQAANTMREHLQQRVLAEREAAGHLAHELRTPLAAARAQAQMLQAQWPAEHAGQQRLQALVGQLDRMDRLATRLLQLARVEAGAALHREPVDPAWLAQLVLDELHSERGAARARLVVDSPPPPPWLGDLDALGIALRNLVENGLRHGGPAAHVVVRVKPGRIDVEDDGPGLAPPALERLREALAQPRQRPARLDGHLGLRLAQRIAEQSDARLELASPVADGRGFRASLVQGSAP
ncbi:sensor histidine kinase [Pelomonas sp. P7]|uniref:histidine kinase n=1 Tax=Pelomonas caseinilytica TaxID=2906763 RepID=A0ABS8XJA0_9BURK|nr:histidine kinase dimerization/phospho-acceptor domain-containing protein [Pelomonas sp. P7]MCE4538906.1 sensor histidine kinase [Pelomonas sp. P7]